jgi:NADH dehydrogenase
MVSSTTGSTSSSSRRRCRRRAIPTSSCSAIARSVRVPAKAAHQEASHLYHQLLDRLKGKPLAPFVYRDFGSLVSLGRYTTVGSLMGFLVGRSFFIEGFFARLMYRSLYKMHEYALFGWRRVVVTFLARLLLRSSEPEVKLH